MIVNVPTSLKIALPALNAKLLDIGGVGHGGGVQQPTSDGPQQSPDVRLHGRASGRADFGQDDPLVNVPELLLPDSNSGSDYNTMLTAFQTLRRQPDGAGMAPL